MLLAEKQWGFVKKLGPLSRVYTMLAVILAWVFFRSADLASGFRDIGYLFGIGAGGFWDSGAAVTVQGTWVILLLSVFGATPLAARTLEGLRKRGLGWAEPVWLLLVFCLSLLEVISSSYNPFIYFNF